MICQHQSEVDEARAAHQTLALTLAVAASNFDYRQFLNINTAIGFEHCLYNRGISGKIGNQSAQSVVE